MQGDRRLRRDLTWRVVGGSTLVLDVRTSQYLSVSGSGIVIWGMLAEGTTRDQIVARLLDEFEVDFDTAAMHVDKFIDDLSQRGLLA